MKLIHWDHGVGKEIAVENELGGMTVELVSKDGRHVQVTFYEKGAYGDLDGHVSMRGWSCPPGTDSRTGNMTEIDAHFRLLPLDAIETLDIIREENSAPRT